MPSPARGLPGCLLAMVHPHAALLHPPTRVAGVMSGTSADGIDVAVVEPVYEGGESGEVRLAGVRALEFATEPFPGGLAERVHGALARGISDLGEVSELHRDLGRAFGEAARAVAERSTTGPLELVACHGQTAFHHDGRAASGPSTLQLGDGDQVAEAAGCGAVTDFRTRDVAAGGEGAPLVALVDGVLFRDAPRPLALLNLGGISNWTILGPGPPRAFDAGPAGALLDGLARRRMGRAFDEDGRVALAGRVDDGLLEELLGHPFFQADPPKSTGRDTFGEAWLDGVLARASGLSDPDLMATGAALVARAAVEALDRWGLRGLERASLVVAGAGGGMRNPAVVGELQAALVAAGVPSGLKGTDALGVDADAREALAFAALGARFAVGEPSTSPAATGAAPGRVLGKWSPGPGSSS